MVTKLTLEDFIVRANKKHNSLYNYSNVKYTNMLTKVEIICYKHGLFHQTPNNHLHSVGCVKCAKEKKIIDIDSFIIKSNIIHNSKYDYSLITNIKSNIKVPIKCQYHDNDFVFYQRIYKHLQGQGCPKCSGRRKSTQDVIIQANKIHNNKYNYSKFIYTKSTQKSIIICNNHEYEFEWHQTPKDHLSGYGCPKCAKNKLKTTKEFIEDAVKIHGNKYDYSESEYVRSGQKLIIKCHNHYPVFKFEQRPNDHLSDKNGCPQCSDTRKTTEQFIIEANQVHQNKYDYKNVNYVNAHTKINIICNNHKQFKIFNQLPSSHLQGHGCPYCSHRVSEKETKWLDSLNIHKDMRQITLPGLSQYTKVDGYNPDTNTVYEFYGDYWHGNPKIYKASETNASIKKSFGKLFENTMEKEAKIKKAGYRLVIMWESDFDK